MAFIQSRLLRAGKTQGTKRFTLTLLYLGVPVSHDSDWALNGMQK